MHISEPANMVNFVIGILKNIPNILLFLFFIMAEKLGVMSWFYPQLKNQPNLPRLVSTLEAEVRKAQIPMQCVKVDIEQPYIFFHLRPFIRITKRNFDTLIKALINAHKLPMNTFIRKQNDLYVLLIDRDWISKKYPNV